VVSFYQSAFVYESDNRLKPGLLTHALAIQALLDGGYGRYDLLAADGPDGSRYKASLATDKGRLAWAVLRRPSLRGAVVDTLRQARTLASRARARR
jgi:CelD/BcsL family acetyltransferase involved in cellulose biosynthesis